MIGLIQKLLARKAKVKAQTKLEVEDIQGIILSSYKHLTHSKYILLKIEDAQAVKGWLADCLQKDLITSAKEWSKNEKGQFEPSQRAMNIAITYRGIQALGGSEMLQGSFPPEFQQGMHDEERSRRIGDFEGTSNHPSQWVDYWREGDVHVMVMLQANAGEIEDFAQEFHWPSYGFTQLETESGYLPADHREHFGFRDAISQPIVEGSVQAAKAEARDPQITKAGEFILGYRNEDGNYPQTPFVTKTDDGLGLPTLRDRSKLDFGRNGSYLVYRKLEQDVAGFRRYFREEFSSPEEGLKMAAKAVGRWPSGVSLMEAPDADPGCPDDRSPRNDFNYRNSDPSGSRCPFAAHIRRMNPRDSQGDNAADALRASQRRRILRRGTIYGEPLPFEQTASDGQERGLHFFCLNANIRRQFEFIQQSWVNNPKFHGLYEERDPLIGMNPNGTRRTMTIPDGKGAQKLSLPNFVTVKGGAYFFVPGLSALKYLAMI